MGISRTKLYNMKKSIVAGLIFFIFMIAVVSTVVGNQAGDDRVALRAQGMDY